MGKNILLIGHGGFYNRGCEAIVRTTVELIKNAVIDCNISLLSFDPLSDELFADQSGIRVDKIIDGKPEGAKRFSVSWILQTLHRRIFYCNLNIYNYLCIPYFKNADVVISVGGDNFTDDYGNPKIFFDSLRISRKLGAKTVIWGATIGPFKNCKAEKLWAKELNMANLITIREDKSIDYLKNLGVDKNVIRVSDPAFLLPALQPKSELPFAIEKRKMRVGIGMSDLLVGQNVTSKSDKYIQSNVDFIKYLINHYGAEVILVPHVTKQSRGHNDYRICEEVNKYINKPECCFVLPEAFNACEMKYCISLCDYFIGARTHSTIASFSSNVPTISIGYSTKAWGINTDVLGNTKYVISIDNLDVKSLIEKFNTLYKDNVGVRNKLKQSIPAVILRAKKAEDFLKQIIES